MQWVAMVATGIMSLMLFLILFHYNELYGGGGAVGWTIFCLTIIVPALFWVAVNITSFKWFLRMMLLVLILISIYFFILFELMGEGCTQDMSIGSLIGSLF